MGSLQNLLIGRQGQALLQKMLAGRLAALELTQQHIDIRMLEVIRRLLHLVLVIEIAVTEVRVPLKIKDAVHALQIERDSFQAIGNLTRDRTAVEPTDLLEIGELGDFHPVQPDLPAQTPGPECW